jgi:hypothetical protein
MEIDATGPAGEGRGDNVALTDPRHAVVADVYRKWAVRNHACVDDDPLRRQSPGHECHGEDDDGGGGERGSKASHGDGIRETVSRVP